MIDEASSDSAAASVPVLLPLTPQFDPVEHQIYVQAIEAALEDYREQGIFNIALTGSYGAGKSSILQRVVQLHSGRGKDRRHRGRKKDNVVQISLSTLSAVEADQAQPGATDPAQPGATGPAQPSASDPATSKTNRIQKEIVKQLLYREEPTRMPGSRYRRIGRFKRGRGLGLAALTGIVITLVFYLTGWTAQIGASLSRWVNPSIWLHGVIFLAATAALYVIFAATHNRIRIDKVTAGTTAISLSEGSTTFFDQYLDEIVYFFEITKKDIVIFEDIDRFDDPHIFETLRALNTLLNAAKQLDGRHIRFVYAIKDSIFESLAESEANEQTQTVAGTGATPEERDAAREALVRANRTKFFDLVIPVVPFITHRSARDLLTTLLAEIEHNVKPELIDVVARRLDDMRLLKNIRNEFVIFRTKVIGGGQVADGLVLDESRLFAMIVYKNIHLKDFENIKSGTSDLDSLYHDARSLIADEIATENQKIGEARKRLQRLRSIETRAKRLGPDLVTAADRIAAAAGYGTNRLHFQHAGAQIAQPALSEAPFWTAFLTGTSPLAAIYRNGYQQATVTIDLATAEAELGEVLNADDWALSDRTALQDSIATSTERRKFLSHADMADIAAHSEIHFSDSEETFTSRLTSTVRSNLARDLIRGGWINRDFTLYTSTYYGNVVPPQAQNFLMHNVDPGIPDIHFQLEAHDVDAVLRERGDAVLGEQGLYNLAVLDRLFEAYPTKVEAVVTAVAVLGNEERQLLEAYFVEGKHKEELIASLAAVSPRTLDYLVRETPLDDQTRVSLVDRAIIATPDPTRIVASDEVRTFIESNYVEMSAFTDPEVDEATADRVKSLLDRLEVTINELAPLSAPVRARIVEADRYPLTHANLISALDGDGLALDEIKNKSEPVYDFVLARLPEYLRILDAVTPPLPSVVDPANYAAILTDVAESDKQALTDVIRDAVDECTIPRLDTVPENAWQPLLLDHRVPATAHNIHLYLAKVHEVDSALAGVLDKAGTITVWDSDTQDERIAIATAILRTRAAIPSGETRVALVVSLKLVDYLQDTTIEPESGELVGRLIEAKVIPDDASTFALRKDTDWKTREYTIARSTEFVNYFDSDEVPPDEVAQLLRSTAVPDPIKRSVLERWSEFMTAPNQITLAAAAAVAQSQGVSLTAAQVLEIAQGRVGATDVLPLLEPLLASIDLHDLAAVLVALGGKYPEIAQSGTSRPKIPNLPGTEAMLDRLIQLGVVSSYSTDHGDFRINLTRK